MTLDLSCRRIHQGLGIAGLLILTLSGRAAHAWAIGSPINETGCHEPITAEALRAVRAGFTTAPVLAPSRDEAALIADVVFDPPRDLRDDLAGMTLLLGVRDNDLKGIDPLSSLDLIQVHGDPTTQDEHCIRSTANDQAAGDAAALAACRAFIVAAATEALDGLDGNGVVDPARRTPFTLYVATRGRITPSLPLFYVRIGAALHALEDGFTHTYRTADGGAVIVVLNWIDVVGGSFDEARDGPPHRAELDRCWDDDPTIQRNYDLSTRAATELLSAALDPGLAREQKIEQFEAIAARYLGFKPGCTFASDWCAPAEAAVTNSTGFGCRATGGAAIGAWLLMLPALLLIRPRRRGHAAIAGLGVLAVLGVLGVATARADDRQPAPPPGAPTATPAAPAAPSTPAAPANPGAPANPAAPVLPTTDEGKEPGRDIKTPTVQEAASVRADKQLGSPWGITGSVGGSVDRAALVTSFGVRYRIHEQWVVGVDAGWNPWVTTSPMSVRAGVATVAATLIRRFPMRFDRVNLRTSIHLGASTLLFDVYGAPKYSTGPYGAFSPLGLDYDLGHAVRIVWDPMEIALPVPLVAQLPLYYEQFRFMIGVQVGG